MLAHAATVVAPGHDPRSLVMVLPLAAITFAAYGRWVSGLRARGGGVSTAQSRLPDLWFTAGLGGLFCFIAFLGFRMKGEVVLTFNALLADAAFKLVLMAVFGTFLAVRNIDLVAFFGLRAQSPFRIVTSAFLFLLAALPAMMAIGLIVQYFSGAKTDEQEIVSFFRNQVKLGDARGLVTVFVTASIMAPIMEELLFRGYFYPTLKRYFGPVASLILVSLLFAGFHANLTAFPALFVLAVCLTVAYEWTGSLLVPIGMHALFNTTSLAVMYYQATHSPS